MFNSFVRSLTRALRTLLEVTSLNMLLRHDARRARDDLLDVNLSLPFQTEVNTGFGVLAKVYLDALTHINNRQRVRDPNAEGVREAKAMALEICEETFVHEYRDEPLGATSQNQTDVEMLPGVYHEGKVV